MKKLKFMTRLGTGFAGLAILLTSAIDPTKQESKIEDAVTVVREFGKIKENIPHELFDQTNGIVIIPKMINAGLGIGGERGKGIAMVKLPGGKWSDPAFITITGGSLGLQAGIQSVDLILCFRHSNTLLEIGKGSFTVGGDASVAAGPVGRSSSANTDYKLSAEIYSYSRSRGAFAGISIKGASLAVDQKYDRAFYKSDQTAEQIFKNGANPNAALSELKSTLKRL